MVVAQRDVSETHAARQPRPGKSTAQVRPKPPRAKPHGRPTSVAVDLHGLTVEDALERAQEALNDALLADLEELRFIHGRSGGRIRAALHRRLRETPSVRRFCLDLRNEGVTIVSL